MFLCMRQQFFAFFKHFIVLHVRIYEHISITRGDFVYHALQGKNTVLYYNKKDLWEYLKDSL